MGNTKYTKELLQTAVNNSESYAGVLRYIGLRQAGGTQSWLTKKIKRYAIDTSHFTGARWNKGKTNLPKRQKEDILVVLKDGSNRTKHYQLKRAMIESEVQYVCDVCKNTAMWNNLPITLEVDHIDGNSMDNRIHNLRFLCPNCHSQQKETNKPHKYASISQLAEETSLDLVNVSVRI